MQIAVGLLMIGACRGWHEPLPFEECQPYRLECPGCVFEDHLAEAGPILRLWQCDDPALGSLLAIRGRADTTSASDTHFYDAETGLRVASVRTHDEAVPVCGRDLEDEWWGEILDCAPVCEIDDTLPEADPDLGTCTV